MMRKKQRRTIASLAISRVPTVASTGVGARPSGGAGGKGGAVVRPVCAIVDGYKKKAVKKQKEKGKGKGDKKGYVWHTWNHCSLFQGNCKR